MKKMAYVAVLGALLLTALPTASQAAIPAVYTNENIWTSEHDRPVSFSIDALGNFSGVTETGKLFYQVNVENSQAIRLQKFSIDEAFYYVSDRGIIIANSDAEALSMYMSDSF